MARAFTIDEPDGSKTHVLQFADNVSITMNVIKDETDSATFTSVGFKATCPECGQVDCEGSCEEILSSGQSTEQIAAMQQEGLQRSFYNTAIDGMESLVLALACEGFEVISPKFMSAIQTTVDAIGNHFPE